MRWNEEHESPDVIDRRGQGGGGGGFGPMALLWIGSRFGLPGILVALGLMVGMQFFSGSSRLAGGRQETAGTTGRDEQVRFVGFVLDDVQQTWAKRFAANGQSYTRAKLVLFDGRTQSGCGLGSAEVGPFYCPRDQRVYIDLSFYRDLARRFGAPGDFAQAYVIAHEIGHHVQTLTGISSRVEGMVRRDPSQRNVLSVRQELQADCYAGIWAHDTDQRQVLERGDIEEGLTAASAIGDDRLQRKAGQEVTPETWTHGSSAERVRWFKRGYERGSVADCDTFAAGNL